MHSATSSSASSTNWRRPSVCSRVTPRAGQEGERPQPKCRPRKHKPPLQRDDVGASALQPENRLASAARRRWGIRSLPWQPAKRSKKSPLHARALARTMLASSSPGTSGLAASKSATGNSTPHSLSGRSNAPRSDPRPKAQPRRLRNRRRARDSGMVRPRLHHMTPMSATSAWPAASIIEVKGASCLTNVA